MEVKPRESPREASGAVMLLQTGIVTDMEIQQVEGTDEEQRSVHVPKVFAHNVPLSRTGDAAALPREACAPSR